MERGSQKKLPKLRLVNSEVDVRFQFDIKDDRKNSNHSNKEYFNRKVSELDYQIHDNQQVIDSLESEIDRLTNHADAFDNMVAVASGIIAGIIDSLWVGEFSLDRGVEWGDKKVENFVVKTAQLKGYDGNDLQGAVKHLEKNFPLSSDSNTPEFGGGRQHHLRDYSHHPNLVGLVFSMLTQFTGKSYGTSTDGSFLITEVKNKAFIGDDLPKKLLFGIVFWFFHMISDISGSSDTILNGGRGTGLPGPLVSLAKLMSTLPIFKETDENGNKLISVWVSKLFNGTLFSERDSEGRLIKESVKNFDLRSELGVGYELGRQAIPVILNECIVRGFFFIRKLTAELNEKNIGSVSDLSKVEWNRTLPFKNRTIVRMMTISTGTFTMVDMLDASVRGAIKSGGNPALFAKEFLLRLNFVGVGRFTIAISTDIYMEIKKEKTRDMRIDMMNKQIHLLNVKTFYQQAGMWVVAEDTRQVINELIEDSEIYLKMYVDLWRANQKSKENIRKYIDGAINKNSGLSDDIDETLKW